MERRCSYCNHPLSDSDTNCPICGRAQFGNGDAATAAPDPAATAGMTGELYYSPADPNTTVQTDAYGRTVTTVNGASPTPAKKRSIVPFIIIGIVIAALIFTVLLIVILNQSDSSEDAAASEPATTAATEAASATQASTEAAKKVDLTKMAGTYQLTEVVGSESFQAIKDKLELIVNADGTAVLKNTDTNQTIDLQFSADSGEVTMDSELVYYTFEDGVITIEDANQKLVFEKKV